MKINSWTQIILITAAMTVSVSAQAAVGLPAPSSTPSVISDQLARLERAEKKLKDWAEIGRYREANARLSAPAKGEDRVVFMGDSITDSWKLEEYFPGKPYINRGISGQTTPQMLVRFRPDVIELKPRALVILAGTNDLAGNTGPMTLEEIEANIATMCELARIHGIRVVLASVLPINDYTKNKNGEPVIRSKPRPPEKIIALNNWIRQYADEHKLVYLDYFSAVVDEKGFFKEELTYDGLHPNAEGYRVMKPVAERAIKTALLRGLYSRR